MGSRPQVMGRVVRPPTERPVTRREKMTRKHEAMKRVAAAQEILRRWDPIGVSPGRLAPADEYDGYAPHIVSLVAGGCSVEDLQRHLSVLRAENMGVPRNTSHDRAVAAELVATLNSFPP